MDATRAVLVSARVEREGRVEVGWGEAAALPPVTREDQPQLLEIVARAALALAGRSADAEALDGASEGSSVARAAIECAILDAIARVDGAPLATSLGGGPCSMRTDVTLPIA